MSKLSASERNSLPASDFAGPDRSYPIPDKGHAKAAKGRAAEFASPAVKVKVDEKADRMLGIKEGSPKDKKIDRIVGVKDKPAKSAAAAKKPGRIMATGGHAERHGGRKW